jgi:hypothetical protein
MRVRNLGRILVAVAAVSALVAGAAFAAKPAKGKTYSGRVTGSPTETVSFTVSKNGKRVTKLNVPIAIRCAGGFGGIVPKPPKKIKITKKGTFKRAVKVQGVTGKSFGKETVTGKFLKGGKESGTITGKLTGLKSCQNTKLTYTTVAAP